MKPSTTAAVGSAAIETDLRYVDWHAAIAGAVLAAALSLVLLSFGAAFGLGLASPVPAEGVSLRWVTIAGGIWLIWTCVTSSAAGGYLAGRMRRPIGDANSDEVEARDGAHGVMAWAVGVVVGGVLAVSGVSGALGAAGSAAQLSADAISSQLSSMTERTSATLLRSEAASGALEAQADVAMILANAFVQGEIDPADQTYVENVIVAQADVTPATASDRLDAALSEGFEARAATIAAADQARIAGMIGAFVLAASLMVSAAAAYFAATTGGAHRDQHLGFRTYGKH